MTPMRALMIVENAAILPNYVVRVEGGDADLRKDVGGRLRVDSEHTPPMGRVEITTEDDALAIRLTDIDSPGIGTRLLVWLQRADAACKAINQATR